MRGSQRTPWRKLLRNKAAVAGMAFIALCILMAIFAYFISPDSSPNANRIIVEIGGQKPGHVQQFLYMAKKRSLILFLLYPIPESLIA